MNPQPIHPEASGDDLAAKYWEALKRVDDLTVYLGAVDKLKAYADEGRVNDMRRFLVVFVDDLAQAHIDAECNRAAAELAEKVSSANFVYEVMNAPTNGAARDWIKAQLSITAESGEK